MRKKYNRKGMALSQIIIILLGTIAFAYIVGSEIGFVSASVTGTFNYGGSSYTLTDASSGCRLYLTSDANQCYAYKDTTDTWYPDTDKDGVVDDGTPVISGLASAVYNLLVPSGALQGSFTVTYSNGVTAIYEVWKTSSGDYVITWGQYLIQETFPTTWYIARDGGNQWMDTTFDSAANARVAISEAAAPTPTPETQTCAQRGLYTCTAQESCAAWFDEATRCCIGHCYTPTTTTPETQTCADYGWSNACTAPLVCSGTVVPLSSGSCCIGSCQPQGQPPAPSASDAAPVSSPSLDLYKIATQAGSSGCIDALTPIMGISPATSLCNAIYPALAAAAPSGETSLPYTTGTPDTGAENPSNYPAVTPTGPVSSYDTAAANLWKSLTGGSAGAGAKGLAVLIQPVVPVATLGGAVLNIFAAAGVASAVFALFAGGRALLTEFFAEHPGWSFAYGALQAASTGFTAGLMLAPTISGILGLAVSPLAGGLIGLVVAAGIFLVAYREYKMDYVTFSCIPWQAPTGGTDCDSCGAGGADCTAYQCASLGTGCELVNTAAGEGKPLCTWVDEGDISPPTIEFLTDVLPEGYTYEPIDAIYPGDTGVLIKYNGGKIPISTVLPVGIMNNKISKCSIDSVREENIDDMIPMLGGISGDESFWGKNHTLSIPILKSPNATISIQQSGEVNLYVKCESRNGKATTNAFVMQFSVDDIPDTTSPDIKGADILSGAPLTMGTDTLDVHIYVSDQSGVPVTGGCRWSHNNYVYDSMENNLTCNNIMNVQGIYPGTYTCTATLTGLNGGVSNNIYFLCADNLGNIATDDDFNPFVLAGTQALVISSAGPVNGTLIKDSTDSVKVTLTAQTAAGFNQGQAVCSFSSTGTGRYTEFFNTNSYQHSHDLYLTNGTYTYYIRCFDMAGNYDEEAVNLAIETDRQAPTIVRVSHENANLNIKTDEEAECVYDIVDCNYPFDSGISMITSDGRTHLTNWVAGRTYYIKCRDLFTTPNEPAQDSCSANGILSTSQF
ncbi:MAG: hypothetical protein PHH00_00845 [Candidatus Nanoarchaeia archaeon]|nr:hypothetical protein [Candidatus Nanoarchaeia archaeon]